MKELFCGYCQSFKAPQGFKLLVDPRSSTPRRMCSTCVEVRKKPRAERDRIAAAERESKKVRASQAAKAALERRRKMDA